MGQNNKVTSTQREGRLKDQTKESFKLLLHSLAPRPSSRVTTFTAQIFVKTVAASHRAMVTWNVTLGVRSAANQQRLCRYIQHDTKLQSGKFALRLNGASRKLIRTLWLPGAEDPADPFVEIAARDQDVICDSSDCRRGKRGRRCSL